MQQTFQCYRCGAQNYSGTLSCWHCGTTFTWQQQTPPVYQQPVNYQQQSPLFHQQTTDIKQQEKNWFQKHLNWTWIIVMTVLMLIIYRLQSDSLPRTLIALLYLPVVITITLWVLRRKSRSWLWFLFPIFCLILSNNRDRDTKA